jgi:threonine synthase
MLKQGAIAKLNNPLVQRIFLVERLKENRYCKSIQRIKSAMTDSDIRQKVLHEGFRQSYPTLKSMAHWQLSDQLD